MRKLLILAGTSEARQLSACITGWQVTASLAGVTTDPAKYPVQTRIGGFGGVSGLVSYIRAAKIDAIIDATHPFAAQISTNAAAAAHEAHCPLLRFCRPEWPIGDNTTVVANIEAAAAALPANARVFLTIGTSGLAAFTHRKDVWFLGRSLQQSALHGHHIIGAPGDKAAEVILMQRHRITHLVTKNAGGSARGKLDAADTIGIPILMVARPLLLPTQEASTIEDTLDWLVGLAINGKE